MDKETLLSKIPENLHHVFAQMHNQIVLLQEENNRLRRALYAAKSEKHIKGVLILPEGTLFNELEDLNAEDPLETNDISEPVVTAGKKPKARSGGRAPLLLDIPRERVVHDLPAEQKVCPHDGTPLRQVSEEVVEVLEFVPATLKVIQNVYPTYACSICKEHIVETPAAPSILPKTQCGPGLLAQIIICKYLLALPLYRQEALFQEMGIELSRDSMARWILMAHQQMSPLLELFKKHLLTQSALDADETPVQVLKEHGKTPQSLSYMWVMSTVDDGPPAVWFE